jgi:hypothetical protein
MTLVKIEDWCKEYRLEISKDKSALMPMLTRNREEYKCHHTIVAWRIKIVSKMRCLGVTLDCKLDWYPQQPCPLLKNHMGDVLPQSDDDL